MTEISQPDGARLRLARQARGLSQQQLAGVAGVTRQAVSAVESGHSDPSLRVALGLARALGVTVEELFGPGELGDPVLARPVAPVSAPGSRVALATVGDTFVALPLDADLAARLGFGAAGGLMVGGGGNQGAQWAQGVQVAVRPIGPPRPTVVVAGCDPALPLLETPLGLLDPPLAFAWWPCGSGEALRLAAGGLQVAAAIVGGLADAGVSSEPAAVAYGLDFIPLAEERFDLLLPAKHAASREVQGLLKVLASPWLLAQLASLPGYDAARCGERPS